MLLPGDTVLSPPGEAHTVGPAGTEDVEIVAELRPALSYEQFMERSFALDRAGHVNAKGRGNPLRMATAKPHEAEFFVPRIPIGLQRAMLRALDRLGRRLPGRPVDEEQQHSRVCSFSIISALSLRPTDRLTARLVAR